jgi:hypothetical protein
VIALPNFEDFPQPPENEPGTLADAFRALIAASNEPQSDEAYQRVLWAVGNDHAGTYFPVVLPAISTFGLVLRKGSPWAQLTALEVLIDWYCAFVPEVGHELFQGESLAKLVKQEVEALAPDVDLLSNADSVARASALELKDALSAR